MTAVQRQPVEDPPRRWWHEFLDAFVRRGNYDPTGRDQEIARLRQVEREVGQLRETNRHLERRIRENHAHMLEVHRIVGHVGHLPDGRVRSGGELHAHLTSLMSHLHPTDVMEAQHVADACFQAARATLYADVRWTTDRAVDGADTEETP